MSEWYNALIWKKERAIAYFEYESQYRGREKTERLVQGLRREIGQLKEDKRLKIERARDPNEYSGSEKGWRTGWSL